MEKNNSILESTSITFTTEGIKRINEIAQSILLCGIDDKEILALEERLSNDDQINMEFYSIRKAFHHRQIWVSVAAMGVDHEDSMYPFSKTPTENDFATLKKYILFKELCNKVEALAIKLNAFAEGKLLEKENFVGLEEDIEVLKSYFEEMKENLKKVEEIDEIRALSCGLGDKQHMTVAKLTDVELFIRIKFKAFMESIAV